MYFFSDLSFERAVQFRDHVVAREPYRLRDLAEWMRDSGGPLRTMDASVRSLAPLWEWFVGFVAADCPGVPDDAVPSLWPFRKPGTDVGRRRAFACESIEHYVRLVLTQLDPEARWEVYVQPKRARDLDHHLTAIRLSGGDFVPFSHGLLPTVVMKAVEGDYEHSMGDWFQALVAMRCPQGLLRDAYARQPSALLRYLDLDLGEPSEIAAVTPVISWAAADAKTPPPPPLAPRSGEDMYFAAGPDEEPEDDSHLTPLPHERVAAALTRAGFLTDDDQPIPPQDLLRAGFEVLHRDGLANLATYTHDATLRAFTLEVVDGGTPEQWEQMLAPLRALANELGARLAPDDEFYDEDDEDD
ncbi:hypothetical protein [Cellulomonas cellasea]|uniref:Uncharacterized protein n=1 Tax=Cellulomonas cellasea TaxID=43670 RepID=A0A7W4YBW9_9CELL|nr:hypothetical protein [Cellulomonas cellasea]MBB2924355.1 hypothetical protein [Cellulomonas cellasea]